MLHYMLHSKSKYRSEKLNTLLQEVSSSLLESFEMRLTQCKALVTERLNSQLLTSKRIGEQHTKSGDRN